MSSTREELQAILYQAAAEPVGVALMVLAGTTEVARQRLYAARKAARDPMLDNLQIRIAPAALRAQGIELLITKGAKSSAGDEG